MTPAATAPYDDAVYTRRGALSLLAVTCLLSPADLRADETTLRMATLAPEGSTWSKAFHQFQQRVEAGTAGRIKFKLFAGGVQGDDRSVLRKIKLGQLAGGAIAGVGLAAIDPELRVLEFARSPEELFALRSALGLRLRHRLEEQGWVVLGWGDIGPVHLFSKIPVRNIEDLRHLKLWQWADDPISKRLYSALNIQGVPLHLPEVLPGLSTGAVDAFFGSPLSTVALQWGTYARYMSAAPITMGTGATVIAQAVWDRLDPNDRKVILDESARLEAEVMARVREDNVRALAKMREGGLQIIEVTPAFEAELEKVAQRVSEEIARDVALEYGQRVRGIVEAVRARRPGN